MKIIVFFITGYFLLTGDCGQGPKLYFPYLSSETLSVLENEFFTLTFWLNTSEFMDPSGDFRMEVETRRTDGSKEYDGTFARIDNLCSITFESSVRCIDDLGPAELYRKVNRSHSEIAVIWRWKDDVSGLLQVNERIIKLNVSYNTEDEHDSERFIFWIVTPMAISLLATVTAICVYSCRRRTTKDPNDKLDTHEKTSFQRIMKRKILGNLSYKQMFWLLHLEPTMESKLSACESVNSLCLYQCEGGVVQSEGKESQIVC